MMNRRLLGVVLSASAFLVAGAARAANVDDFRAVSTPLLHNEAKDTFDGYLKKLDIHLHVTGCSTIIYSHPGTVETIYGGACRLSTGADVTVCGDTGVGEFALSWGAVTSKEIVARFASTNCPGG